MPREETDATWQPILHSFTIPALLSQDCPTALCIPLVCIFFVMDCTIMFTLLKVVITVPLFIPGVKDR